MKVQLLFLAALVAVAFGKPSGKSHGVQIGSAAHPATKSYGAYTGPAPVTPQRISYTQARTYVAVPAPVPVPKPAPAPTSVKVVPVIQQRVAAVVRPVIAPVGMSLTSKGGSSRYHVQDELGQYNYGFTSSDGQAKTEIRGIDGSVAGRYSYVDPEGKHVVLSYVADKGGFRVAGNNLPKAPELPPQLAQEYAVAKVRVAAAKARGASTDGQYVHDVQGDDDTDDHVEEDHDDDDDDHDDGQYRAKEHEDDDDDDHDDGQYRANEHDDDDNEHHQDDEDDDDKKKKDEEDEDDDDDDKKTTYIVGTLVPTYSVASAPAPAPAPKPAAQVIHVVQSPTVQKSSGQVVRVVQAQAVPTAVVRTAGIPVQTGTVAVSAVQTRPAPVPVTRVQTYTPTLPVKSVGGVQQLAMPTSGVTVPARAPLPTVSQIYAVVQPATTGGGQAVATTGTKSHGTTATGGATFQVPVAATQYVVRPQVQVAAAPPTKSHTYAVVAPQQAPVAVKSSQLVGNVATAQQTVSAQVAAVPQPHVKSAYAYTG